MLNIREALKKIQSANVGAAVGKECWFNLIQKSIKVAGEGIGKKGEVLEMWDELGRNKYIMSQVVEKCMRQ